MCHSQNTLVEIEQGAIFVSDSHYPNHSNEFLKLLQKIHSEEIQTSQLFLMGDNFDLLIGSMDYSHTLSADAIELISQISKKIEVYYFEGNHDFNLKLIFSNITIYSRHEQPQYMLLGDKRIGLSHGDRYDTGFIYEMMTFFLRSTLVLRFMKLFQRSIIDKKIAHLKSKSICHKIKEFNRKVVNIKKYYKNADVIAEGHFHQGVTIYNYTSLPSLACQKQVGVVSDGVIIFVNINELLSHNFD